MKMREILEKSCFNQNQCRHEEYIAQAEAQLNTLIEGMIPKEINRWKNILNASNLKDFDRDDITFDSKRFSL